MCTLNVGIAACVVKVLQDCQCSSFQRQTFGIVLLSLYASWPLERCVVKYCCELVYLFEVDFLVCDILLAGFETKPTQNNKQTSIKSDIQLT